MTLTIGQGLWIHGGYFCITSPALANTTLINNGLIEAEAGTALTIGGAFYNNSFGLTRVENTALGRMRAATSGANFYVGSLGTLSNAGGFSSAGTLTVDAGQMTLFGEWQNREHNTLAPGTITHNSGTLNLGGTLAFADLGTYNRMGTPLGTTGTVNLTGTLNLGGSTLRLDRSTTKYGTWIVSGGTINGGTVQTADTAQLQFATTGNFLNGVTLASGSEAVLGTNAAVTILNNLTVNGKLTLGSANGQQQGLLFNGTQTLGGAGEIVGEPARRACG